MADRELIKAALATLVDRMRDDSLDAVEALLRVGHGRLLVEVPRSAGAPVEASAVLGGIAFETIERRVVNGRFKTEELSA